MEDAPIIWQWRTMTTGLAESFSYFYFFFDKKFFMIVFLPLLLGFRVSFPPPCWEFVSCICLMRGFIIPSTFIMHATEHSIKPTPYFWAKFSQSSVGTFRACWSSALFPTNKRGIFFTDGIFDFLIPSITFRAFIALCVDVTEYIIKKPSTWSTILSHCCKEKP